MRKIYVLLLVITVSLILVGCSYFEDYMDTYDSFCDSNPSSEICKKSDEQMKVIVLALFEDLLIQASDDSTEFVCEDFFETDELLGTCNEDYMAMLPEDYLTLKEHFIYSPSGSDYYEIDSSVDVTQDLLYVFKIGTSIEDGNVFISTFSFTLQTIVFANPLSLESTLEGNLNEDFNIDFDGNLSLCEEFTYGKAKIECGVDVSGVIGPHINSPVFSYEKLDGDGRYEITKKSQDGLYEITYDVEFILQNDVVKVSEIHIEVFEHFNNDENARIMFIEFLNELLTNDNIEDVCSKYAFDEESDAECKDQFISGRCNDYEFDDIERDEESREHDVECRDDEGNSTYSKFTIRVNLSGEYKIEFIDDDTDE